MHAASAASILLAAIAVSGCSRRYYYSDGDRPRIETTSPADNESGVSTEALIRVVFTERMRSSSIDRTSFYVSRASDNAAIEGAIRLENDDRTAVFTPIQFLEPGVRYEVTVTDHVESRYYGYLSRDARFSFTTASTAQASFGGGLQFAALAALYDRAVGEVSEDSTIDPVAATVLARDVTVGFVGRARSADDPAVVAVAMRLAGDEVQEALHALESEGDQAARALLESQRSAAVEELRALSIEVLMRRLAD